MLRTLTLLLTSVSMIASAGSETSVPPRSGYDTRPAFLEKGAGIDGYLLESLGVTRSKLSTTSALACCKVCKIGKACGDTCISRSKTCHVGQGCACDG
jgi:hypothetical protein